MSYREYLDLFIKAQDNPDANYYVVSFDVVNSSKMSNDDRLELQYRINDIVKYVYNKLLEKEIELNKQVVINDNRFFTPWTISRDRMNCNFQDPFIFGDCFEFTVLRNTVTKDEIVNLVNECKCKYNLDLDFHINDGYYETNNYEEGRDKYYRGYCLETLGEYHKPFMQKKIKKIKRKMR